MMGDTYTLGNGFWINSKGVLFDLGLDEDLVMADCTNFSYISGKLIVTKKKNVITIFSASPIEENNKRKVNILASFSNTSPNIFANVIIDDTCYTIDYNCQVTTRSVRHNLHPKIN